MTRTNKRIVVQVSAQEKRAIVLKAKKMGLSVSELMRRGALAYEPSRSDEALEILADAAIQASERAGLVIEDALDYIEASNQRIAMMELNAKSLIHNNQRGLI